MRKLILYVVNDPAFFVSHRMPLALEALEQGWDVAVATPPGKGVEAIREKGLKHYSLPLNRAGMNPWQEVLTFIAVAYLFYRLRPQLAHLVTIKPVLYGGVASRLISVPSVVFAISGMGHVFGTNKNKVVRTVAEMLYRLSLAHANSRVIVQNDEDARALVRLRAIEAGSEVLIRGSGVDLSEFNFMPIPTEGLVVLLPARMLWEKGVGEFVEVARQMKASGFGARFVLAGGADSENPSAVPTAQLEKWDSEHVIEWWGKCKDMPQALGEASIVVLPTYYREGLPKALLEALAVGRPVVTTNTPGCRDVVEHGWNGLLVEPRNVNALAEAIATLLQDRERLEQMGRRGREKAEAEFSVNRVVAAHMKVYNELVEKSSTA